MAYKYPRFIQQNTAPKSAKSIGIYDKNGTKIFEVPIGGLIPTTRTKRYSFGLLSDMHIYKKDVSWVTWNPIDKFDDALSFFEAKGCDFCAHCGDFTQTGLYDEGDTANLKPEQFANYKEVCDKHDIPVYGICGNHESYVVQITNNLTELKSYTGTDLYYTMSYGDDLFIFIGQPKGASPMSDEALQWLYETLEANRNKRCFVMVHPHINSGNPMGAYKSNQLFQNWNRLSVFKNLMSHYKNTLLFHGHSHTKFECQEQDPVATYSTTDGFRSIHIPSASRPRDVVDGELVNRDDEGQGYIIDVYDDCVMLNGVDLINNKYVPIGVYKIDTSLQTITANTFKDSTGVITT